VTSLQPSSVDQTATYPNLIVNGTGFDSSTTVTMSNSAIQIRGVTYVSPTELTLSVHVPGTTPLGATNVTATNDHGSGTCTACLTVVAKR
jgi:hypothetical protein